jgi:hypothetical protein
MDGMSNSEKMRVFAEAYGVMVRAGVMTPNIDDEIAIREIFGLPPVNDAVKADWKRTKGTRQPITIAAEDAAAKQKQTEGTK